MLHLMTNSVIFNNSTIKALFIFKFHKLYCLTTGPIGNKLLNWFHGLSKVMRPESFYTIYLKVYQFLCSSIKVFIFILCDLMCMYDMCHLVLIYLSMSDLVPE